MLYFFHDNILPNGAEHIFRRIAADKLHYRFGYEIRANTPRKVLEVMKDAGGIIAQIGLEALSTSLLNKLHKQTRTITNLQAMKICEELGIITVNNLITNYPLSVPGDVKKTIQTMECCFAYRPPKTKNYRLGFGSPDYAMGENRGFKNIQNSSRYDDIYPCALRTQLNLIAKDYDFDPSHPKADWSEIEETLEKWKRIYYERSKSDELSPHLLTYYDGKDFLIIFDQRFEDKTKKRVIRLTEIQRKIYLFADDIKPWNAFKKAFDIPEETLKQTLDAFVAEKLMFEEDGFYLSLAMCSDYNKRPDIIKELQGDSTELPMVRDVK